MLVFLEILKFTLPAVIVVVAMYMVMHKMFSQEDERRSFESRRQNSSVVLPIRLRAYERLVLFLERTTPESILMRFDFNGLSVLQLQQMLVKAVRDEYEHNLSQQIYVSHDAWLLVCNARESIVQLINSCAAQMKADAPAMELAQALLSTYAAAQDTPTQIAIDRIKNEVKF